MTKISRNQTNQDKIKVQSLRQFDYPPDMQKLETETVLKQSEIVTNEITNE